MIKLCRFHHLLRSEVLRQCARKSLGSLGPRSGFHTTSLLSSKADSPYLDNPFLAERDITFLDRLKENFAAKGKLRYPLPNLNINGTRLYIYCAETVCANDLMKASGLPQTFFSWHQLLTLHIWLLLTRLITEGREGRHVRNSVIVSLQKDVKARCKQWGNDNGFSIRPRQYDDLIEDFIGALFVYDEGLLGDDKVLAGALWRHLFNKRDIDVETLALFVQYVRKQAHFLQLQPAEHLLRYGHMQLLPLHGDKMDRDKHQEIYRKINKMFGIRDADAARHTPPTEQ